MAKEIPGFGIPWNPIRGCSKVPGRKGCANCYAESMAMRFCGVKTADRGFGQGHEVTDVGPFHTFADSKGWTGKVEIQEHILMQPLRWRKPRRVFISMADPYHESLTDANLDRLHAIVALTPHIEYFFLTKREERMEKYLKQFDGEEDPVLGDTGIGNWINGVYGSLMGETQALPGGNDKWRWIEPEYDYHEPGRIAISGYFDWLGEPNERPIPWPLPNLILGTSVSTQREADLAIPHLLRTPAARRQVSYSPALEAVNFVRWLPHSDKPLGATPLSAAMAMINEVNIDLILIEGESGPKARPFDIAWARDTIRQCKAAGVPVFVKQLGSRPEIDWDIEDHEWPDHIIPEAFEYPTREVRLHSRQGIDPAEWPEELRVREEMER